MQPVPVQRSSMRRGFLGVDGWEERRRREARWVIIFSVSPYQSPLLLQYFELSKGCEPRMHCSGLPRARSRQFR